MRRTIFSTAVSFFTILWLGLTPVIGDQKGHAPASKPTPAAKPTPPLKTTHFVTRIENNSQLMSRLQLCPPCDAGERPRASRLGAVHRHFMCRKT
jgi:hypothetical protein